jgi:hypothetical protein
VQATTDGSGKGTLVVKITKHFGTPVLINSIVAQPIGRPSAGAKRIMLKETFSCEEGAELQLGAHWASLVNPKLMGRVLPGTPPRG